MRQATTKDLHAYWSRLKGARAAPDRVDIDPGEIRHLLADTFMIEVDSAGVFPIRLFGTRLNSLWGSDKRGGAFLDLWREADRQSVAATLLTAVDSVSPIVGGVAVSPPGLKPADLELLILPLRNFGSTHSRLLGSLVPTHDVEWLGKVAAGLLHLHTMRVVGAHAPPAVTLTPPPKFPGVRRLVVYEGGKSKCQH